MIKKITSFVIGSSLLLSFLPTLSLAQTSPTTQPLVQQADMVYLGKFTVPATDGTNRGNSMDSLDYGAFGLGMGADGQSLYFGCHDWHDQIARVSIPALGGQASILTPCTAITNKSAINPSDPNGYNPGGTLVWNGKLFATMYAYYDAGGTALGSHFSMSTDMTSQAGPFRIGPLSGSSSTPTDRVGMQAGYMGIVPQEWRTLLGGPALTGLNGVPIISRTSSGPTATIFDPDNVGTSNKTINMLLGYPYEHQTLGTYGEANQFYAASDQVGGLAFPSGTRSVLFVGRHATTFCYGYGTSNQAIHGTTDANGVMYCYDPTDSNKGGHGYPYIHQVWAYDANDLLAVKQGTKKPWDVKPYTVWKLTDINNNGNAGTIGGATYDPATKRFYLATGRTIHVYEIKNASGGGGGGGGGGDTTLPSVSMSAPSNGTTVSGSSVTVSANASDNVGVVGVQFKLNGSNLGSEDTSAPYSVTWNTTTATNGSNTLTAVARDSAGNTATASNISVTVDNSVPPPPVGNTITVNPGVTYQTMRGWEVVAQASHLRSDYANFQNTALDKVVEAGINRIRLEVRSGSENTTDSFLNFKNAGYPSSGTAYQTWRAKRYETINDNNDPNNADSSKFYWSEVDSTVDLIINPLRQKLAAKGEKLYVNLNYVAFYGQVTSGASNVHQSPAEYAEFMLEAFKHFQSKYGWVPDSIEVVLEPDNTVNWNGSVLGQVIAATGARLSVAGFNPEFIAPGTTNMSSASSWFDSMWAVTGARPYLKELSYHRYSGVSTASLQAIASKAQSAGIATSMLEWWDGANTFNVLHEDLKLGRNSAWEQATLVDLDSTSGLGITYINPSNPSVGTLTNPTKFNQQYYKYVRMGAKRIDASSTNSSFDPLAFVNTDGKYTVVVKASNSGSFSVKGLPAGTYGIYYTASSQGSTASPDLYAVSLADQTISSGGTVTGTIPAYGVITVYSKTGGGGGGGGGDTTAPTVSMSAPANGSTVSGIVSMSANATDNVGVAGVQFKLDGANFGSDLTYPYSISWDTSNSTNGSHSISAEARDAVGNAGYSSQIQVNVNNSVSSKFVIGDTIKTTANVNVRDTASASGALLGTQASGILGKVIAGPTSSGGFSWWKVDYNSGADGWSTEDYLVKYTADDILSDTVAPTVKITAPEPMTTVAGIPILVSADATDNVGVAGVQFKLDGVNLLSEDVTSPYSVIWDTTNATEGAHVITAIARDAAGNKTTSSSVTVTVTKTVDTDKTPPTVSITAPTSNSEVWDSVTVSADAFDDTDVAGVQFKLDGADLLSEDNVAPYSITWNTKTTSNGSHNITAVARDTTGNKATSEGKVVRVGNDDVSVVPPTVTMTDPTANAELWGTVNISANASDNLGVAGVQFKLNGTNLLTEDSVSPYSISWNTKAVANGTHTLTATVRDVEGNQTTSAGLTVRVDNDEPEIIPSTALKVGDKVKTTAWVNVRRTAGGSYVGSQRTGRTGTIINGPTEAKGLKWWKVNFTSGVDGWVAANYLSKTTIAMTQDDYRKNIANIYLIIKYLQERLSVQN